jgi:hypothetical protein
MKPQLSEAVKELIAKARIVSFVGWEAAYPSQAIQLLQTADDQGRYLTDEESEQLQTLMPSQANWITVARSLRDQVNEIVNEARAEVLATYPDITQAGGALYPPERADACWRDFWHFLRCITYGIIGQRQNYTSPQGLHAMQRLYQELQVPLSAMVVGLESIKQASLKRIDPTLQPSLTPYFDHLITQLQQFQPATSHL